MTIQRFPIGSLATAIATALLATVATAGPITLFSTGNPDGRIATASRPSGPAQIETETADDFVLGQDALISAASFTGLLPSGAALDTIQNVGIQLYHVFPVDSTNPPLGDVPTRTNSPSDHSFAAYSLGSGITAVTASILNTTFTTANSVVNGINKSPNQTTGGEGPVTGEEVLFNVTFTTPFFVGATDHDFFRPEVGLSAGSFLWLSAPKPIVSGTPFNPDLQAWIRNANLDPDWLRIGTDIVGGDPAPTYNMAFSLTGTAVPEPSSALLLGAGLAALAYRRIRSS